MTAIARVDVQVTDLPEFKAFLERTKTFVGEYAWHLRSCSAINADGEWHVGNPECDCGYEEDLRKLGLGDI